MRLLSRRHRMLRWYRRMLWKVDTALWDYRATPMQRTYLTNPVCWCGWHHVGVSNASMWEAHNRVARGMVRKVNGV